MQKLYERQTSKDYVPYPEARFEDEYAKLVNDIITLSTSTVASSLKVENGVAQVTPENANAAKAYIEEFNAVTKALKFSTARAESAKKKFEKLDAKMKALEEEGRVISPKFQKRFDEAKEEYLTSKREYDELAERKEYLMNYTGDPTELERHAERDRMLRVADMMRTAVYLKTFKDNPLVQEAIEGKNGLLDCSDILTKEDLEREAEPLTEEEIARYRKQYADQSLEMLDNMEMDFKNGLMVDGMGVGLSDEEMSRTPEYARGYQWAKVKQAVEFVHYGLKHGTEPIVGDPVPETPDLGEEGVDPKPEEKKPAKQKRLNASIINSENAVIRELEDTESATYKYVLGVLTRKNGKFNMTKEEASAFIFNFADKVTQAHDAKMHAKDVFDKDSAEYYILRQTTTKLMKAATLQL